MNVGKTILKNSLYIMISTIVANILSAITGVLIVRYLGKIQFGYLSTANTFANTLVILTYCGTNTYILKVGNFNKEKEGEVIANSLLVQAILTLIVYFVGVYSLKFTNYKNITILLANITLFSTLISTLTLPLGAFLQTSNKFLYISLLNIISSLISSMLIIIVINFKIGLKTYCLLTLYQGIIMLFLYIIFSKKILKYCKVNFKKIIPMLKISLMFGASTILYTVYYKIDSFMISIMKNEVDVGIYNSAYKIFSLLLIISGILDNVVEPIMFKLFKNDRDKAYDLSDELFKYSIIIGLPISFGIFSISGQIINLFYGKQFNEAIPVLAILAFAITFRYGSCALGFLLTVSDKMKDKVKIQAITAIENIVLNAFLIPKYSYNGAAFATVVSELTIFLFYLYIVINNFYKFKYKVQLLKSLLSSCFMCMVIIFMTKIMHTNIFINILIGVFIYLILCILLKIIDKSELHKMKKILR